MKHIQYKRLQFFITFTSYFLFGCTILNKFPKNTVQEQVLNSTSTSLLLNKPSPVTTSFADTKKDIGLPSHFGDNMKAKLLNKQPKNSKGNFLLMPGFYEMTCKSYCLHAGTYGPSNGDGYLYAPLKGEKAAIIQTIIRNSTSRAIPQSTAQLLIWAVLARTNFKDLSADLKSASIRLLTPEQLYQLNGGALGLIPSSTLNKLTASLPPQAQQVLATENKLRQLFTQVNASYQDFERLAILPGKTTNKAEYPAGEWSKNVAGYYIRYFPNGYRMTKVQVYVPENSTVYNEYSLYNYAIYASQKDKKPIEYDASANVAVPANTSSQRLAQSNDDAGGADAGNENNNFDPCKKINANDPNENHQLTPQQRLTYKQLTDFQKKIATNNNWQPNQTGFDTPDEAAKAAIYFINQESIAKNIEYAGNIYLNPETGKYYFSQPAGGSRDDSQATESPVPSGSQIVGVYHTHSGNYYDSDETFSPGDIFKSAAKKAGRKIVSYLGTPRGKVLKFDPTKKTQTPCAVAADLGTIEEL